MPDEPTDVFAALAETSQPAKETREPKRATSARKGVLEKELEQFFTLIALVVSMFNQEDSADLMASVPRLAGAWSRLAAKDARVRAILEALMSGGAYTEAMVVTFLALLPILKRHKLLPGNVEATITRITDMAEEEEEMEEGQVSDEPTRREPNLI